MVGVGVDIGVHAQGDIGRQAACRCQFVDYLQFGYGLHIEAAYATVEGEVYLRIGLAHAGKHNLGSRETGLQCRAYLAAAHAVGSESASGNEFENGRIAVGFDGIVHAKFLFGGSRADGVQRLGKQLHVVVIEGSGSVEECLQGKSCHKSNRISVITMLCENGRNPEIKNHNREKSCKVTQNIPNALPARSSLFQKHLI